MHITTTSSTHYIGRLEYGDDLLAALTAFCVTHNITAGTIAIIGAVQKVTFGYYSQTEKKYTGCHELNKKLEIASGMGNISLKDGKPFCHIHGVFADYDGTTSGGHIMPGTIVFACEFSIQSLPSEALVRTPEPTTGLPLWNKP